MPGTSSRILERARYYVQQAEMACCSDLSLTLSDR